MIVKKQKGESVCKIEGLKETAWISGPCPGQPGGAAPFGAAGTPSRAGEESTLDLVTAPCSRVYLFT
jgi:hypothetical protein